jgi:hypothetical protein
MLAHLYEKEPGLGDAIAAISACAALTSWKKRQQTRKFPKKERGLEIVYGFNYRDVADDGWLSDVPSTQFRSVVSGQFKPIARDLTNHGRSRSGHSIYINPTRGASLDFL